MIDNDAEFPHVNYNIKSLKLEGTLILLGYFQSVLSFGKKIAQQKKHTQISETPRKI